MLGDAISGFELFQPTEIDQVVDLLSRFGDGAWVLAGGYDSLDWFKDRHRRPAAVIDLQGVAALNGIRSSSEGTEIGAMTTLAEIQGDPGIRQRIGLLADAASCVASPQIRNAATLGGNVCQDARCWYYRYGVSCYRAGGNTCYAAAPQAMNREHAIFGASRCVAVTPSDVAPALVALDATMVVRSPRGEREIAAETFFMPPSVDITRMTVLEPEDLLVSIRIPAAWENADFYHEKVADRGSWDFALASIAAAFRMEGSVIDDARVVCGAVQCTPLRLQDVERELRGQARTEALAVAAGVRAVEGAEPLGFNAFKVPLTQNLVKRAVLGS
jgi:xanthine dehydrogenase YagS FAD-binding subunit